MILIALSGAFFVAIAEHNEANTNCDKVALWTSSIIFCIVCVCFFKFDTLTKEIQCIESISFDLGIKGAYIVGFDKLSIVFSLLTAFCSMLLSIWTMFSEVDHKRRIFAGILIFEACAIGAFCSFDIFTLYFFVECSIIPMLIVISSSEDSKPIEQFLVYSLVSAVLVLVSVIFLYNQTGTSNLLKIIENKDKVSSFVFWILSVGVSLKLPLFPFTYWLPIAHVKTKIAGSVLLASIVLKFGMLLLMRLIFPIFTKELVEYRSIFLFAATVSAFIACSHIFFQKDLKKLIAYFSIIHMSMYFFGVISGTEPCMFIFSNIMHSLTVALLFFLVDYMESYYETRIINRIKSSEKNNGLLRRLFFAAVLCLIGAPITGNFIAETSVLAASVFAFIPSTNLSFSVALMTIIIISSAFVLFLSHNIFFRAKISQQESVLTYSVKDKAKLAILGILLLLIIYFGLFPSSLLK
jgi:NADH-quinone oxidoreductase subunit M